MKLSRIGMDIAKSVFQLHGVDSHERVALKKRLRRAEVLSFFRQQASCEVAMEACGGAHYWARELVRLGHRVKLIAPQFVKPYVKGNKHDAADAEAICEAMSRAQMRFVAVKSVEQQEIQAIHRIRSELIKQRTMKGNQIRGLLAEHGVVIDKRLERLRTAMPLILEDADNGLTLLLRALLSELVEDLRGLDARVGALDERIACAARQSESAQRLQQIPGIGPITATALVAAVGDARAFKRGRDMAAWLGLVPAQHSSGGRERMLGISKRGDTYVRMLLIHGARSVARYVANKTDDRSRWLQALGERRHKNVAVVALANKNARIAWALLTRGEHYRAAVGRLDQPALSHHALTTAAHEAWPQ